MTISSIWVLRLLGMAGVFGAVLFIAGDLLYNHIPGSKKSPAEKMSVLPESRLLNAGTLGLIGCWFYTLASALFFIAFQPVSSSFGLIVFLTFGAVMICYGISHTAYFAIASGAKTAVQLGSDKEDLSTSAPGMGYWPSNLPNKTKISRLPALITGERTGSTQKRFVREMQN